MRNVSKTQVESVQIIARAERRLFLFIKNSSIWPQLY